MSLLAAPKTADAITTRQLLDRGGVGLNPVCRRYPSPATQAGINAGIFSAQSFAFYLTERIRHAWISDGLAAHCPPMPLWGTHTCEPVTQELIRARHQFGIAIRAFRFEQ